MAHDLIDEYRLWVHPVVLGMGSSFFEDGAKRMDLELVDSTAIPSGVAILTYRPERQARGSAARAGTAAGQAGARPGA
jgi:dihydrofolate reductase